MLQLPAYVQLERYYPGLATVLELMSGLYDLPLSFDAVRREAERQRATIDESVQQDPRAQTMIQELETAYDTERAESEQEEGSSALSPELDRFLREVEERWNEPENQ
jgi:hypothetical protein